MRTDLTRTFSERGDLEIGALAGEYIVTELLARGGCGAVYRALHALTERPAALKVLHASLASQPKMVERFAREVDVVNLLGHPSIVKIYEVGALPDGRPFYAMEYLTGRTLGEVLRVRGRLPPDEVLALFEPVCAALGAAHRAGVVHRDIKAGNVMVKSGSPPGVKLLDFGIAKLLGPRGGPAGLTSEGRLLGTPTVMSPEQLRGGPIDARTDVYALGVLLFRALTASLPFDGPSAGALAHQHLVQPPPRPSDRAAVPAALDAIVLRCLEKLPDHRYGSVEELFAALHRAIAGAGRSDPSAGAVAPGIAVYLEIRTRGSAADLDEATSEDVGAALDIGEQELQAGGFIIVLVTGTRVLGVRLVSSPERASAERAEAIDLAVSIRRALDARAGAAPGVHVNVSVHAGDVLVRAGTPPEVLGGTLVRPDSWAPRGEVAGVAATPEAVEGLAGLALVEGYPGVVVAPA